MKDAKSRLAAAVAKAAVAAKRYDRALAKRPKSVQAGNILRPPQSAAIIFGWVLVKQHPDDRNLWFMIPVDTVPWIGVADLMLPEDCLCRRLVLRGGWGVWGYPCEFPNSEPIGIVEDQYVEQMERKLAKLVRGEILATDEQKESAEIPVFDEWQRKLAGMVEEMEEWLNQLGTVITSDAFTMRPPPVASIQTEFHVAAASSNDLVGKIAKTLGDANSQGWYTWTTTAGDLQMRRTLQGIELFYLGQGAPPRLLAAEVPNRRLLVSWKKSEMGHRVARLGGGPSKVIELCLEDNEGERLRIRL